LLRHVPHQLSIYSVLYDKIPDDHILKTIAANVDFSFINDLLKDSYCKHLGRPAKEPEMLAKLLICNIYITYQMLKSLKKLN